MPLASLFREVFAQRWANAWFIAYAKDSECWLSNRLQMFFEVMTRKLFVVVPPPMSEVLICRHLKDRTLL